MKWMILPALSILMLCGCVGGRPTAANQPLEQTPTTAVDLPAASGRIDLTRFDQFVGPFMVDKWMSPR